MALLRKTYCLWKCYLACCPHGRRNSNNPKPFACLGRKKDLAFALRGKGRDTPPQPPQLIFFSCQTAAEFKPNQLWPQPTHSILVPVKLVGNQLHFIQGSSSRAFMASSRLRNSNNLKVFHVSWLRKLGRRHSGFGESRTNFEPQFCCS